MPQKTTLVSGRDQMGSRSRTTSPRSDPWNRRGRRFLAWTFALLTTAVVAAPAVAQAPYRIYDPFYRGETARRAFFDGYALTTEIAYRAPGSIQDGRQTPSADPFGLSFKLDYEIGSNVDVSAIVDAASSIAGRKLTVQWLAVKMYHRVEYTDYAFRLAVDPAFDGRVGFPQMDLAFLSTSLLTPSLSSDYALGMRRVRFGFEQLRREPVVVEFMNQPVLPSNDIVYTRALGWELHLMMQHSLLLNPARSNLFVSFLLDVGRYDLLETSLRSANPSVRATLVESAEMISDDGSDEDPVDGNMGAREYRGGVFWVRTGFEYNRPSYQVHPFINIPLSQWMPEEGGLPSRVSLGIRLVLR